MAYFAQVSFAACAELLCIKDFKLFHTTVCCFVFSLHPFIDNGMMNTESATSVDILDDCVLFCSPCSSAFFGLFYLGR